MSIACKHNEQYCVAGTSLVVHWLRICLAMQGTWVQSLVRECPIFCETIKPAHYN